MIIVFDGVCNICNGWVQFVFKRDRTRQVRFASIQSPAGQELLSRHGYVIEGLETLLVVEDDVLYVKTEAIRHVLLHLHGFWGWLAAVLNFVPVSMRDWVYTRIAVNRYSWFGRRAECAVPSEPLATRFLESREDVS